MATTADHALIALLWSETADDGTPLDDAQFRPSAELRARVSADWAEFQDAALDLGFDPEEHLAAMLHPDCEGDAWNAAAHDFILTRNGHGTGFWESGRWAEPWNRRLTALAESFGELHCWADEQGVIHAD
jgi:hypothetical protein